MIDREWVGELHVNKLMDESSCEYFSIQVNPQEAGQQRRNHNLMYNHCSLNITRTLLKTKARPWNPYCFLDCFIMQKRSLPSLLHSAACDIWIDYSKMKASLVYSIKRDQTENSSMTFNPLIERVKQNQNKIIYLIKDVFCLMLVW